MCDDLLVWFCKVFLGHNTGSRFKTFLERWSTEVVVYWLGSNSDLLISNTPALQHSNNSFFHDLHRWYFTQNQNPGSKSQQVSDVRITPGVQPARRPLPEPFFYSDTQSQKGRAVHHVRSLRGNFLRIWI